MPSAEFIQSHLVPLIRQAVDNEDVVDLRTITVTAEDKQMKEVATSNQVGPELLKLLGIDSRKVQKAVITIEVNDHITVELKEIPTIDRENFSMQASDLMPVMKKFKLTPVGD